MNKNNPSSIRQNNRSFDYLKQYYNSEQTPANIGGESVKNIIKGAYNSAEELRRKRAERQAKERAEAEKEQRRKQELEDLRKKNAEISKREYDNKLELQKRAKEQQESYADEQKARADKQYEKDYEAWSN